MATYVKAIIYTAVAVWAVVLLVILLVVYFGYLR